jgi:hypothetical protein
MPKPYHPPPADAPLRVCGKCGRLEAGRALVTRGHVHFHAYCRLCKREYDRVWAIRRRIRNARLHAAALAEMDRRLALAPQSRPEVP